MLKIGTLLRIVLTIFLIAFPVCIIAFFISKKAKRYLTIFLTRISSLAFLRKFKRRIIFGWQESSSHLSSSEESTGDQESPVSDVVVIEKVEVDVVQNIVQTPISEVASSLQDEEPVHDKELFLKNKKLLERIVYEALVLRKEWRLDEYEKKLIEWLALDSSDKDLNRFLADYYFSIGNHKKALSLLKKIVELDPKDHKAIWQIGEIYLTSWDFETAELLIEKAISINPANPKYYISMVELYYNTDRKLDAVEYMEHVVRLRPTNAGYMLTLADLYEEINDLENAQKYYFRVLEYEPSNEKAKKKLKELIKE